MAIVVNKAGYNVKTRQILTDINFEINEGSFTAILGSNGSGKSSLVKAIVKLNELTAGYIEIDNSKQSVYSSRELAKIISYLAQTNETIDNLTVEHIVRQGTFVEMNAWGKINQESKEKIEFAINLTGLQSLRYQKISALSGGEVQRVWLALCLAQDSKYIILDEPTNHLDIKYKIEILKLVKELNQKYHKTIIVVIHDLNLACRFATDIILLKGGKAIKQGTVDSVITKANIDYAFDVEAVVETSPVTGFKQITIM